MPSETPYFAYEGGPKEPAPDLGRNRTYAEGKSLAVRYKWRAEEDANKVADAFNALGEPADPCQVPLDLRQAVVNAFATQGGSSPFLRGEQPEGSLVPMWFVDPQTRTRYDFGPVPFADESPNIWYSTVLSRPA